MHYYLDDDVKNRFGDAFVVQGGIRLHANDQLSTIVAYEGNDKIVLTIEFQF
jgi:hypothetical protein